MTRLSGRSGLTSPQTELRFTPGRRREPLLLGLLPLTSALIDDAAADQVFRASRRSVESHSFASVSGLNEALRLAPGRSVGTERDAGPAVRGAQLAAPRPGPARRA